MATMTTGARALLVAIASALIGAAYFAYLNATPFPPGVARLVPLLWLAAAVAGVSLGVAALRAGQGAPLGLGAVIVGLPSAAFGAIFALAAAMGD